ncbi:MAG: nuclear transport factor 2 family protein [Proteobacteria bacterium]|nr:nuclear transport factor 2 family protein [Pseudomonadota bacterium]
MRSLVTLATLAVLATAAIPAAAAERQPGVDEQAVLSQEVRWMDAMTRQDGPVLDQVLAPEFTLAGLGAPGRPGVPRAVWIDNALHHLVVQSERFDETHASVFGDTAVVNAVFSWRGVFNGEAFTDKVTLVDVWVRRGGRWQVVSRLVEGYRPPED